MQACNSRSHRQSRTVHGGRMVRLLVAEGPTRIKLGNLLCVVYSLCAQFVCTARVTLVLLLRTVCCCFDGSRQSIKPRMPRMRMKCQQRALFPFPPCLCLLWGGMLGFEPRGSNTWATSIRLQLWPSRNGIISSRHGGLLLRRHFR